jgi:HlyD family secretion protein
MQRRLAIAAYGALALALVAGGGTAGWRWWWLPHHRPAPAAAKAPPPDPSKAIYEGAEITLSGKVQPQKTIPVAAPISGTIEEFAVEPGQEVAEGQLLARIRNDALTAANQAAAEELDNVNARLENLESMMQTARLEASRARSEATRVRSDHERLERLFERQKLLLAAGATPRLAYQKAEREYQQAKSEYESLDSIARAAEERVEALQRDNDNLRKLAADKQADADQAKAHLDAGEVHSPVDGVVVARHGQAGDQISPAVADLLQIAVDTSQLKVTLSPEPPVLRRLRGGEPALVTIPDLQFQPLPGQVKSIEGGIVVVEFATPDPQIKPGLNAVVRIRFTT